MKGLTLVRKLKKQFGKDFGPKCPEYYWSCHVCEGYRMIEALEELYDLEGEIKHGARGEQ